MTIVKIRVGAAGEIWCDGVRTTLAALRPRLAEVREQNGAVWYHREASGTGPAPEAMAVIQLAIELRLPISMSTRADFGDVVQPDGRVVPRGPDTLS